MEGAGFQDALEMIERALSDFSSGQLIHIDIGMLDLMGAAEIMDSRTDSFLQGDIEGSSLDLTPPRFNPHRDLSDIELLWVLDEIFRLEMTFHEGNTLGSTIFACQYFRVASLLAISGSAPASSGKGKEKEDVKMTGGRRIVLRAAILALLKTMEIVFEELFRALVYEHEDVQLGMAGQTFPSLLAACFPVVPSKLRITNPNDPPEERIVTVDDVFSAICDATEWIEANVDDLEVKISLLQRFSLRSDFIYGTAYLSSPFQTTEDQIRFYLSRALATATAITNTPSPLLNFQPPLELQAIFRRGAEVPLSSLQPIRVLDPLTRDESCSRMINMIGDLTSGLECWKGWNEGTSWEGLREYGLTFARRDVTPYARSVHQTIVAHASKIFGGYSVGTLAISFLISHLSLPPELFNFLPAIREQETSINSPARKILGWLDKLGNSLNTVHRISCQNRPRAMRLIMKGFGPFRNLIEEGQSILSHFTTLLPQLNPPLTKMELTSLQLLTKPIVALLLSQILEGLLSGFEFDLYDPAEHPSVYWVSVKIASRLELSWQEIFADGPGDSGWLESKLLEARMRKEMSKASWIITTLSKAPIITFSPFLTYHEPSRMGKARFQRRFEWITGELESKQLLESFINFDEFITQSNKIKESPESSLDLVKNFYESSSHAIEEILVLPAPFRGNSSNEALFSQWMNTIKSTAQRNNSILQQKIKVDSILFAEHSLSSWFPTLQSK